MSFRPHRLAFPLVALTYVLLVFGSTVRVHGAGLACPDWPLCFGEVVPAYEFKVYLEFGHRVVAGIVSLGFLTMWVQSWRQGLLATRRLGLWFVLAALVLAAQVVLGGLTVLELLAEWTVSSHLVTGNTFCALLLVIALTLHGAKDGATGTSALGRALSLVVLMLVPSQIVLGGLVSASGAGLACGTWPACAGEVWFPTFQGLVGLQVMHRILAYTVAAAVWISAASQRGAARRPALVASAVVLLQVALGVANVFLGLPAEVTLLHSAGAAALMLSATWTVVEAWRLPVHHTGPAHTLTPAEAA